MTGGEIIIPQGDLPKLMAVIAEQVAERVSAQLHLSTLPTYYKFPEDLITMTGGYFSECTIRSWKTAGYIRTFKISSKAYVRPEDWEWFLKHHSKLMASAPNNRRAKLEKAA